MHWFYQVWLLLPHAKQWRSTKVFVSLVTIWGALDTSSCQDAHAPESGKHVKDTLSWPELGRMEWSRQREVSELDAELTSELNTEPTSELNMST